MTAQDDDEGAGRPPVKVARDVRPLPKRFYKEVSVGEGDADGFAVLLDGRPARTPKKLVLKLPSIELARAIAGEWAAQDRDIDPARMPISRIVNTAMDSVAGVEARVAEDVVRYSGSDLVCYRAEQPQGLVARQEQVWGPVLAWAEAALGARFVVQSGLMPIAQPAEAIAAIARAVAPLDALRLSALHVMTTLSGSALLALGTLYGTWTAEAAWAAAHVDEDWQIAQWGEDGEARARRDRRWVEMAAAGRLVKLLASRA
ncbi:MAG: ATP12 family protein [Hyphomicrobiaceae bacterium]